MVASELEHGRHLFQPPMYSGRQGDWHKSYDDAVASCEGPLDWDPAGFLSILSFGYACGDLTLLRQIRRRPWLSCVDGGGIPRLEDIPRHDTIWLTASEIAAELLQRLSDEAESVCQKFDEVYVLLSGGLDSRIVAGVLANLRATGRLRCTPKAVTWGLSNSRDVYYGRITAELLGFPWQHLDITAEHVWQNIIPMAAKFNCNNHYFLVLWQLRQVTIEYIFHLGRITNTRISYTQQCTN